MEEHHRLAGRPATQVRATRTAQPALARVDQHLALGPHDLQPLPREYFEKMYDELIANPGSGKTTQSIAFGKGDIKAYVEVHRRALFVGDKWFIISISRDITSRKLADRASKRMSRMYAALSATNEAIVHAQTAQDMFDRICRAAVEGGGFLAAAVVLPADDDSGAAHVVSVAGLKDLRGIRFSINQTTVEGRGLVGGAFVFLSTDRKEFALFVLSYTPPMQERWQLLEKHPIAELGTFKVTLLPPGEFRHGAIKACGAARCETYSAKSAKAQFKKARARPAS